MSEKTELPPLIRETDQKYPTGKDGIDYTCGNHGTLTFYNTTAFGWCIATLPISAGRRGQPERTYAIKLDGTGCRIGNGPHVTKVLTIYVKKSRVKALEKYINLYLEGMARAGTVRDRISSRRAEGVEKRAAGRSSWRWDN